MQTHIFLLLVGTLFIGGCATTKRIVKDHTWLNCELQTTQEASDQSLTHAMSTCASQLKEYEARLIDVPPYWGAQLKKGFLSCDQRSGMQWLLEYEATDSKVAVLAWYENQMDSHGWLKIKNIEADPYIQLFFIKPFKKCFVTMTENKKMVTITVWVFEHIDES